MWGFNRDNGKEHGNYRIEWSVGFRDQGVGLGFRGLVV